MLRTYYISSIMLVLAMVGCSSNPASTSIPQPTAATVAAVATVQPQPTNTAVQTPANNATPAPTSASTVAAAQTVQVEAWDEYFRPEKITVTVGTKITWVNLGQKKHNVAYGNLFDQDFTPGETFSYTFDKPGVYQYYCVQHSLSETEGMVGTITVVAP